MATRNRRIKRTLKRKTAENKRRQKIQAAITDYKSKLLMLKVAKAAGCDTPRDDIQAPALRRLIAKYEAILTEDRR